MDLASDEWEVHGSSLCVVGCFLNTWPWSLTLAPTPVRRNTSQNAIWLPVRCCLHVTTIAFIAHLSLCLTDKSGIVSSSDCGGPPCSRRASMQGAIPLGPQAQAVSV